MKFLVTGSAGLVGRQPKNDIMTVQSNVTLCTG